MSGSAHSLVSANEWLVKKQQEDKREEHTREYMPAQNLTKRKGH